MLNVLKVNSNLRPGADPQRLTDFTNICPATNTLTGTIQTYHTMQFREWTFNTVEGGIWSATQNKITIPHLHFKISNPLERVKKKQPPLEHILYIYPNSIVFHENGFFLITFIKKVCQ